MSTQSSFMQELNLRQQKLDAEETAPATNTDATDTEGFNPFSLAPYELFPDDLKQEARWLVYKMEWNAEKGKNDKIPHNPMTGFKANNPALGVTFDVAISKLGGFSGPGIYVEPPYIVVDIDDCRDSDSGVVAPWAMEIIRQLDTYAEASPSGTGVHIWLKGKKPGGVCRKGIEIYSAKRFMTVTGKPISGAPLTVNERDVTDVYNRMLAGEFENSAATATATSSPSLPASKAKQVVPKGLKTTDLYSLLMHGRVTPEKVNPCVLEDDGGSVTYESRSEADMALCALLAQRHDSPDVIDAEFRKSSLYRDKWEERKDYRERTINAAIKFAKTNAVVSEAVEDEPEVEEESLPDFPKFSGSLMELCESQFPEIPYEFKMMAAVTHFGLIRSGLDKLESEPHLQSRFYTCFIKSPGWGKTAALNEIRKCMRMVGRYSVTSSIDSGPALVDELADCAAKIPPLAEDRASRLLLDPDEMSGLFEKSKVSPSSRNTLFNELLKLYEANRTGNRSRKSGKSQVDDAHLAIIGGATEEGYPNMWTGTGGGSTGLQSRMVLITTSAPRMPINKSIPDTTALSAAISRLQKQAEQPGQVIRMDDVASKMLQDWWSGSVRDKGCETRVEDMVKRLCIVLAVTNDTNTIGRDLMAQAIQFGDYVIAVREKFNPLDSYSWTQAFENLIQRIAERHKTAMTFNDFRRLVHPNRKPGGLGPFMQAWKNMLAAGVLKLDGKTERGTGKYRL